MQIYCPVCHETYSAEGSRPKFCSQCGSQLSTSAGIDDQAATLKSSEVAPEEMLTFPPTGDNQLTQPLDPKTRDSAAARYPAQASSTIGPYRIIRKLGQGGMGSVFEAEDQKTGKRVALKLLSRTLLSTDDSVERFRRESQIAASINHPRSTFVYEAGESDHQFYITMELMSGGTLKELVEERGPFPVEQAVDHVLDTIDGLQPAHEAGIVHRDLKPSNCFIDHEGRVKIGDFGLAKSFLADSSLTRTGTFMGTPQFAAPEQLRASEVDEKADIYALGGTLFYLLSGRAPFEGNAAQVIASIASDTPPEIDTIVEGIPRELSRVIHQTLEKDPNRRPENLTALRSMLLPFSTHGASQADLGRRMAAFFMDSIFCAVCVMLVAQMTGVMAVVSSGLLSANDFQKFSLINTFVQFGTLLTYFAIPEWKFGVTPGKWLMGMRVINQRNESPALLAALVRAAMIPGLAQLCVTIPTYLMKFGAPGNTDLPVVVMGMINLQFFQLLSLIPSLLIMSTARRSNGYRGIHDFLTRTRVVRLSGALESTRPKNIPITIPMTVDHERDVFPGIENLRVIGKFSDDAKSAILLAKDNKLDRDVWVAPVSEFESANRDHSKLRPTQIRTLAERSHGDSKLLVTEALKGCQLLDYLKLSRPIGWSSLLPVIQDVVLELIAREKELDPSGTLIAFDRIWINQQGQVKFLDRHVPPIGPAESDTRFPTRWSALQPVKIIETLVHVIIQRHVVPEHVWKFREEITELQDDPQALRIIEQKLEAMEDRASRWTWVDRLGVLAASYGIEYAPMFSLATVVSLFLSVNLDIAPVLLGLILFALGSSVVFVLGYFFRGGPVFRFSGVSVRRNHNLESASAIRCAMRNLVSWLPAVATVGLIAFLIESGLAIERTLSTTMEFNGSPLMLLVCGLGIAVAFLILLLGAGFSVVRPSRGIADLICSTRLIRR